MNEQQRTLAGFGLDETVPTRRHADDLVECSDGALLCHADVVYDVKGGAHSNDDDRDDAEVEVVRDILKGVEQWNTDYCTGEYNGDYGDGYAYIVSEVKGDLWPDRIREWLDDNYDLGDADVDAIVDAMCDEIDDWDSEYDRNDYACYSGPGICLYSLDIGETEEQIDLKQFDELSELHDLGRLEGILESLDREFCLYRNDHYDQATKSRVKDGFVSGGDYPHIMAYFMPGGQWHYVVSPESAKAALLAAIEATGAIVPDETLADLAETD